MFASIRIFFLNPHVCVRADLRQMYALMRQRTNVRIEATIEEQSAKISFLKFADNYAHFR